MALLLCRNRVENYTRWRAVFDSNLDDALESGLKLKELWRSIEDPNNIFFLFEVDDIGRAKAFMNDPSSAEAGKESGVVDGEYHFIEDHK